MSLLELVQASAQRLQDAQVAFGHGTANAFDEAAWLVLWQLGLPLDTSLHNADATALAQLDAARVAQVQALITRRIASRLPAAYLTREAWLQGVPFYVDERVIVPRSFIAELLVNESLDPWLDPATQRVLDLCTGNGSLAVIAAMVFPDVQVDASDISSDALAVARINVHRHALQDRITLVQSDGLAALDARYDLILCNPPYVSASSMAALPAEYQAEPALALDGNVHGSLDGMDFVRDLLRDVLAHMTENAVLVLEIGNERAHFEAASAGLDVVWMSTQTGDDQVLLLCAPELRAWHANHSAAP